MDVFLSEGMEIIFKVALSLLTIAKDDLLSLDMEGMLKVSRQNNLVGNGLFIIVPVAVFPKGATSKGRIRR